MAGRALIKEADVVVNSNKKTYKVLLNVVLGINVIIGYPLLLMSFIYKYIIILHLHVKPSLVYITDYLSRATVHPKRRRYSHSRITHFLVKVVALNITLKVMFSGTWKWSILCTVV